MRHLLYFILLAVSCVFCYTFKPVDAQAQRSMSSRGGIGSTTSLNMLRNIAPTRNGALISVDSAYFSNSQWYKAIFQYSINETRPANGSRIYVTVAGKSGAWNVYKFMIDKVDVRGVDSALATKIGTVEGDARYQLKGTYVTSETDPLYSANGVPRTRTINTKPLSADVVLTTTDVAEGTNQYFTTARALAAVAGAGYVKNVQLGGGSNTFTISSLLAGATVNVTIPLNTTFTDNNYQVTQPTVVVNGGISVLSSLTVMVLTKNTTNVVVQIRNNALLAAAVNGTIDVVALKVVQ